MPNAWKQFQGQIVNGKFPLSHYLGGSDHSAVFLTQRPQGEPRKAAMKLIACDPAKAERQLDRWVEATKLSHPNLIRLFEMGRCRLGEKEVLYLVMEYAEEDLSQVVGTRFLNPQECQDMLPPVLEALGYLHRQGFVHGRLKPANVMAAREQIKLSSDGLIPASTPKDELRTPSVYDPPEAASEGWSAAADVWSLGMLLVELLTQKVPVLHVGRNELALPPWAPRWLVDVVRHCLRFDRRQRWTTAQILARVGPAPTSAQEAPTAQIPQAAEGKPRYGLAVAALAIVLAVIIAGLLVSHRGQRAAPAAQAVASQPAKSEAVLPGTPAPVATARTPVRRSAPQAVAHEVLPRVPQSARDTIQGTIRVRVRVAVDAAGNVTRASFDSRGPSKYFARLSMQAAQDWKFTPAPGGSNGPTEWLLRFEFRRDSTHAIPTLISR